MPLPAMRRSGQEAVTISATSVFAVCDGLLRMVHCFMVELPESDLRAIRYTLEGLSVRADQTLNTFERDLSLNFDALAIDLDTHHPPGAEDFGAILVSTAVPAEANKPSLPPPPRSRRKTVSRAPTAPATTPAPSPTTSPTPAAVPTHGTFPYILSSRPRVGRPDYTNHPYFVRPGIPGPYQYPPTKSGLDSSDVYYVISKGLYVGVFEDWREVEPWVLGVPGCVYRGVKTWEEARSLYNSRLACGAVQILT